MYVIIVVQPAVLVNKQLSDGTIGAPRLCKDKES